ncbi:UNVERIFIED_ORG: hypothetical protein LHK14_17860 [Roseateles sp. XES5]|nr:hypothetical protein [Roseateles sp. XES5]
MADRCPTCGGLVASVFEHVDIDCRPIDDAPRDGTIIIGLYQGDELRLVRWEEYRSHPGGGGSMGAGWVSDENGFPDDAPDAWAYPEEH